MIMDRGKQMVIKFEHDKNPEHQKLSECYVEVFKTLTAEGREVSSLAEHAIMQLVVATHAAGRAAKAAELRQVLGLP